MISLSKDSDTNWKNDHLQFARLIAELEATHGFPVTEALCKSMDLHEDEIQQIISRAQKTWDVAKANTGHYFDEGDWVWWQDPDNAEDSDCSCFGIVKCLHEDHVYIWRFANYPNPTPYVPGDASAYGMAAPHSELVPACEKMTPEEIRRYRMDELITESCTKISKRYVRLRED
jgi:hypothetical protein